MYLDTTNGIEIGLLTDTLATTAVATLPLQHPNGTGEHLLSAASLALTETAATLTGNSGFLPTDHLDTHLVTHATHLPIINVPVQGRLS